MLSQRGTSPLSQIDAASSPVLKGLYESERNETKANPVFITQDAKRTNELSPDGRLS
jgi:hypothetical protein